MSTGPFDYAILLNSLKTHNWRAREFTGMAEEVLEVYDDIYYAVERCVASREDYEMETYECCGDLFVFHRPGGKEMIVVDYYKLDEETYEKVYRNITIESLPKKILRLLTQAMDA